MTRAFYTTRLMLTTNVRNILLFMLLPFLGNAQTVLENNGGGIYIQEHALVHIQGDFVNYNGNTEEGGGILNDGTIEIEGNFENMPGARFGVHDNFASTDRVVKLVGSGKQAIIGNMSLPGYSSFYNLVIDKVNATDTVEMQTPTTVEGSLIFGTANTTYTYNPTYTYTNNNQKGLLKTFDANGEYLLDIQNGSPDAIGGFPVLEIGGRPNTGFILNKGTRGSDAGGLRRAVSSATSYVFPVGTPDKGFNGVRLNFTQIPGNGSVKAKFCSGSSNPTGHIGKISQFCVGCSAGTMPTNSGYNRYFTSNECNGGVPQWMIIENTAPEHGYWSFESSNTGYDYDMEVFPNSIEALDLSRNWRVLKHEATYGADPSSEDVDWMPEIDSLVSNINDLMTYTRNAGCYSGDGIPGGHYKNFSHFALGMGSGGNALPVELMFVKAESIGKHRVRVSWATALEINNRGFEVHRSVDAVNFTYVGWVDGHNNSTVTQNYSFDDRPSESGIIYYKLKQIDNDDAFTYSHVVQVRLVDGGGADDESTFKLYPNPTANDLFLEVSDPVDEVKVNLYDVTGKSVYENFFPVEENNVSKTFTINASRMVTTGTYILTATTNGKRYSAKVVLQ